MPKLTWFLGSLPVLFLALHIATRLERVAFESRAVHSLICKLSTASIVRSALVVLFLPCHLGGVASTMSQALKLSHPIS